MLINLKIGVSFNELAVKAKRFMIKDYFATIGDAHTCQSEIHTALQRAWDLWNSRTWLVSITVEMAEYTLKHLEDEINERLI